MAILKEFFFNSKETQKEKKVVVEQPTINTKELIQQIHNDFYTEVDKLLESTKLIEKNEVSIPKKIQILRKHGFLRTKESLEAEKIDRKNRVIKWNNEKKERLKEAIDYFSFKYPMYKFITIESVYDLCEKYNLNVDHAENYTGYIPSKNLEDIDNFKIDIEDERWEIGFYEHRDGKYVIKSTFSRKQAEELNFKYKIDNYYHDLRPSNFDIVAPEKDFIKGRDNTKYTPDPIVLKPVLYKEYNYFLIVTAWGEEAGDNLVINPNHN